MPRTNFSKIDKLPDKDKQQIESLAKNGYSFKYIAEWLETKGFKIHEKTVQTWHKKFLESIAPSDEKASKALSAIEKLERDTTPNPIIDDEKELKKLKTDWGLTDNNLIESDPHAAIGASQKMMFDLFMDVGSITKNRLNLYKQGQAKFPIEQIKGLKLLYEMYAPLIGVNELVSTDSAIKTLENYGYDVKDLELQNNSITINKNDYSTESKEQEETEQQETQANPEQNT